MTRAPGPVGAPGAEGDEGSEGPPMPSPPARGGLLEFASCEEGG
jgi:hypothetical protein